MIVDPLFFARSIAHTPITPRCDAADLAEAQPEPAAKVLDRMPEQCWQNTPAPFERIRVSAGVSRNHSDCEVLHRDRLRGIG
jgi:hypothetical protein